jgi:lysophospholipase L1-like esterase
MRRDLRRARAVVPLSAPAARIVVRVRPARPRRSGQAPQPLQLAALGDSSIAGIGSDRTGDCLAVQIARRVADMTGRTVHVRGYGVSGARTADVARAQVGALATHPPPDVLVVVVGANDIVHVTPPTQYLHAVSALYEALCEQPAVPVIACSLPEVRAITIVGHPLRDVAVAYGRLLGVLQRRALRNLPDVHLVDARRIAGPSFLQRPEAMASDGFHPSGVGYALLADALAPAVTQAVTPAAGARGHVDAQACR